MLLTQEKKIELNGQTFRLFSIDGGRCWFSCAKSYAEALCKHRQILATRFTTRELGWIEQIGIANGEVDRMSLRRAIRLHRR